MPIWKHQIIFNWWCRRMDTLQPLSDFVEYLHSNRRFRALFANISPLQNILIQRLKSEANTVCVHIHSCYRHARHKWPCKRYRRLQFPMHSASKPAHMWGGLLMQKTCQISCISSKIWTFLYQRINPTFLTSFWLDLWPWSRLSPTCKWHDDS